MKNKELAIFGSNSTDEGVFNIDTEDKAWELLENLKRDDFVIPNDIILGDWSCLESGT